MGETAVIALGVDLGNPLVETIALLREFFHEVGIFSELGACAGERLVSSDRAGTMAAHVERPHDGILREPQYFFQLPGALDPPYPTVPRFSHWRFPHNDLPPLWQRWAADAAATQVRGGETARRCVLSNYADSLEMAHLLPAGEDDWWLSNQMQRFSPTQLFSSNPSDGPANLLTLRAQLRRVFDERHFCFVPKVGETSERDGREAGTGRDGAANTAERNPPQLVPHVFNSTPSGQLPNLWHNRAVHPIPATVAVECLFARFAWTVLSPHVFDTFLPSTSVPRRLLLWSREKGEWETEEVGPEMCRNIWKNARSCSPQERKIPGSADTAKEGLREESASLPDNGYFATGSSLDDGYYNDELSLAQSKEEQPRGRSRKRRLSFEETQDYDDADWSRLQKKRNIAPFNNKHSTKQC
jgi:hypothetical protein